jgi:hypothetical protein
MEIIPVQNYTVNAASRSDFDAPAPGPILTKDYINGRMDVGGQIKYYYFPIDFELMGLPTIILNKTKMSGQETNGDTYLIAKAQPDVEANPGYKYQDWSYPSLSDNHWIARSNDPSTPVILKAEGFEQACLGTVDGCALIVGVISADNNWADYRIRGFYGKDELEVNKAHKVSAQPYTEGQFERWTYHWFVITDAVDNANAEWTYYVAVGTDPGSDPNLYVSLVDGRYPSINDCDKSSH